MATSHRLTLWYDSVYDGCGRYCFVQEKGNKLLASASNRSVPFYLHRFGKEGVNFNVDQSGRPYIWCEVKIACSVSLDDH